MADTHTRKCSSCAFELLSVRWGIQYSCSSANLGNGVTRASWCSAHLWDFKEGAFLNYVAAGIGRYRFFGWPPPHPDGNVHCIRCVLHSLPGDPGGGDARAGGGGNG